MFVNLIFVSIDVLLAHRNERFDSHLNCVLPDNCMWWRGASVESSLDGAGERGREFPSVRDSISSIVFLVTKLFVENVAIRGLLSQIMTQKLFLYDSNYIFSALKLCSKCTVNLPRLCIAW